MRVSINPNEVAPYTHAYSSQRFVDNKDHSSRLYQPTICLCIATRSSYNYVRIAIYTKLLVDRIIINDKWEFVASNIRENLHSYGHKR